MVEGESLILVVVVVVVVVVTFDAADILCAFLPIATYDSFCFLFFPNWPTTVLSSAVSHP